MALQHLKVSFTPILSSYKHQRLYTYFNDDPEDIKPGDIVEVETRNGRTLVRVVEVTPPEEVPFPLKPARKVT